MLRLPILFAVSSLVLAGACASDEESPPVVPTPSGAGAGGSGAAGGGGSGAGTSSGGSGGGGEGGGFGVLANCEAPSGAEGALATEEVETGLSEPMVVTYAPGEPERMYIAERGGRILVKEGDQPATEFVDLDPDGAPDTVLEGGERGLLGLAFHPDYADNGRFFVHFSGPGGGDHRGVLAELQRDPDDPLRALPEPVGEILAVDQPAGNHNGGTIAFSPLDGLLHWAVGDGGGSNDTFGHGQDTDTLFATILRLDVDGGDPYAVPTGNLGDGAGEIWQWGLRNPFRMSFDPCTGDLYVGDVGQNAWEEIDVVPAGAAPGNWGWPIMEGDSCFDPPADCPTDGLLMPAHVYAHSGGGGRSVTGGAVYRGSQIPWLRGTYFFGDFATQQMWTMRWTPNDPTPAVTEVTDDLYDGGSVAVSAVGQDARGELYVVDYGQGRVLRIVAE